MGLGSAQRRHAERRSLAHKSSFFGPRCLSYL